MGTLTADCPRLDSHCPHKLATSCGLTATHNCCACADERPHSSTYSVYIDGVGMTQRGTRWQGYCWYCREFWNNRLAATDPPLHIRQTRIPDMPDQTEFLENWFEYHQGYRVVKHGDGREERVHFVAEQLKEVSPGFLPRSLDEMRRRIPNDALRPQNRFRRRRLSSDEVRLEEPQQSIEDALDSLIEVARDEEDEAGAGEDMPQPTEAQQRDEAEDVPHGHMLDLSVADDSEPAPRSRAERRARWRQERFVRLYGTREDIERDDYVSPLASMYGRAYERFRQAEAARASGATEAPSLDGRTERERQEIEQQIAWGVLDASTQTARREERANEDRPIEAEAPLPRLFEPDSIDNNVALANAINSLSVRISSPHASESGPSHSRLRRVSRDNQQPAPRMSRRRLAEVQAGHNLTPAQADAAALSAAELRASIEEITEELTRIRQATAAVSRTRLESLMRRGLWNEPELDMDKQNRPPALEEEEMKRTLSCQVCYSQLANIALIPCGHMVLCGWCADATIPVKHSHVPIRKSNCPVCRKQVKQRVKIHV